MQYAHHIFFAAIRHMEKLLPAIERDSPAIVPD